MTRTRFVQLAAAGLLAAAFPVLAGDEALPTAETIIDRYIEVTGGKKAYEKHKSEVATLTMELVGKGIKATGMRYSDTTNSNLVSFTLEGIGKIETGVTDGVAWETNALTGARVLSGVEKADRLREARFNAPLYWRELWKSAETTGVGNVDGEDCYKVVMTPNEGKPETNYYSKKTGLLVKQTRTVASPMGEMEVEILAQDYKAFDGVQTPSRVTQKVMGNEMVITLDDVKFDTPIPPERYDPPADVKKLLAK